MRSYIRKFRAVDEPPHALGLLAAGAAIFGQSYRRAAKGKRRAARDHEFARIAGEALAAFNALGAIAPDLAAEIDREISEYWRARRLYGMARGDAGVPSDAAETLRHLHAVFRHFVTAMERLFAAAGPEAEVRDASCAALLSGAAEPVPGGIALRRTDITMQALRRIDGAGLLIAADNDNRSEASTGV